MAELTNFLSDIRNWLRRKFFCRHGRYWSYQVVIEGKQVGVDHACQLCGEIYLRERYG